MKRLNRMKSTLLSLVVAGIATIAATPVTATAYFFHNDHLGTPQVVTDVNK